MKSNLDSSTTPDEKYSIFENKARVILQCSRKDIERAEKEYQAERATQPKRGPRAKRKPSPLGHASFGKRT
jgi:hypothetical protein